MESISDELLIEQIKQGDVLAFEIIVRRYQLKLVAFTLRIVQSQHDAEEIVQDTLFSVYKTIDRIDTTRKFSSYLFAAAKNTAITFLRQRKKTYSLDQREIASPDKTLYEHTMIKDRERSLKEAIKKLTRPQRLVISLYYFHSYSYQEISDKLKLPLNTVRTHLHRAKWALRQKTDYENF